MGKSDAFLLSMAIHYAYLGVILWSIVFPEKRIWPPLKKWSWQFLLSWLLFFGAVSADVAMMVIDRSAFLNIGNERLYLSVPIVVVGVLFLGWGILTLGIERTSGVAGEFISTGPYKFTRNPQYIGDILIFLGMILFSNSFRAAAGFSLLILAFLLMPLAEELWLEEAYGEAYKKYKMTTPRFF